MSLVTAERIESAWKISETPEIVAFMSYVESFYGEDGIYAKTDFATYQQIFDATMKYLTTLTEERTWGGGDSVDRERVGYILENEMSVKLY
jgi:hypothetical protein